MICRSTSFRSVVSNSSRHMGDPAAALPAQCLVVGDGVRGKAVATEIVRRMSDLAPLRIDAARQKPQIDEGTRLVIACGVREESSVFVPWLNACWLGQIPALPVSLGPWTASVGPMFLSGEAVCYRCSHSGGNAAIPASQDSGATLSLALDKHYDRYDADVPRGHLPEHMDFLSALVGATVSDWFVAGSPLVARRVLALDSGFMTALPVSQLCTCRKEASGESVRGPSDHA